MEHYQSVVITKLSDLECDGLSAAVMDLQVCKIYDILVQASEEVRSKSVKQHGKARLNVLMPEIRLAVCTKKKTFCEWKQSSKLDQSDHL